MTGLAHKQCVPCRGGVPPLSTAQIARLSAELGDQWAVVKDHHLSREYKFKNFRAALSFVNKVGELAEEQSHHPDILLAWGRVKVDIWTHKIDGLTESDFIFAAKVERLSALG